MRHLAESDAARPVGCTQSTEIIITEGVMLSGSLPKGCELSTMYTAAVATKAADAQAAQKLIELLTSADQHELRERAGFLSAQK
jgi:molybdate transport system substrate-binding protein